MTDYYKVLDKRAYNQPIFNAPKTKREANRLLKQMVEKEGWKLEPVFVKVEKENDMAVRKKKASKKKGSKKKKASKKKGRKKRAKKSRSRKGTIPLQILEKRQKRLTALVKKRGGTVAH